MSKIQNLNEPWDGVHDGNEIEAFLKEQLQKADEKPNGIRVNGEIVNKEQDGIIPINIPVLTNELSQASDKAITPKAVQDKFSKYEKFKDGTNETTWQLDGEIAYYQDFASGYKNFGVMQHTKSITATFNHIRIGPVKAESTCSKKYGIFKGAWANRADPSTLTKLKEGNINLTTSFQQFDIELDEVVELNEECVFVYIGATNVKASILGTNGENNAPSQYSGTFTVLYTSNSSTIYTIWSSATGNRYAVQPILSLLLPPEVNDVIDARITAAKPSIVQEATAKAEEVEAEFDAFQEDTDRLYRYEGDVEYYSEFGYGYGSINIGQYSVSRSEETKVTSVVCGPIKTASGGSVSYDIVLTTAANRLNPAAGTLLKSGSKTIGTSYTSFEIAFDEEVTIPAGSEIAIYYYSGSGGNRYLLGDNNTTGFTRMPNSPNVIYKSYGSSAWVYGNNGYVTCRPILKYHKDSGVKQIFSNLMEEATPGLIEALGQQVESLVETKMPSIISDVEEAVDAVEVYLPDKIVAVVGDKLELFWRAIVKAVNPYVYDISVACSKGSCFSHKYSFTPTAADIGTTTLTVKVRNRNGLLVGTATTSLITVAAPQSPAANKNVFCIGDSLTSGGEWPCEAKRRLTGSITVDNIAGNSLQNITFCGSKEKTLDYGNSKSSTANFYGKGGWSWATFQAAASAKYRVTVEGVEAVTVGATYTNNSKTFTVEEVNVTAGNGTLLLSGNGAPSSSGTLTRASGSGDAEITFTSYITENENPLWDSSNSKFSFIPYVEACGNRNIDVLYVLLSWNGQSAWKTYSAGDTTGQIASAKSFIDKLHAEYPVAKVKVLGLQMPSVNDGLGQNYGCDQGYTQRYGLYVCAWNYNKALQDLCNLEAYSAFCEFVDVATQFDSEYNFPGGNSKANKRNTTTYYGQTNGVHPSNPGYYQIADVVYRNFVKEFCQGE